MTDERTMPHAIGYEKSALSSLLNKPALLDEVAHLTRAHFYHPTNAALFDLIVELAPGSEQIDLIALIQKLNDRGELEKLGGPSVIADIYTYTPNHSRFFQHVAELNTLLARRLAISAASELAECAHDTTDATGFLDAASGPITAIHETAAAAKPSRDTKQLLGTFLDNFEEMLSGRKTPMGLPTSIPTYNRTLGGIHGKRITIIAGYPTSGKSLLGSQFCLDLAFLGEPSAFISLELPSEGVIQRAVVYASGLDADAVCKPLEYAQLQGRQQLSKDELQRVSAAVRRIKDAPFYVEDPTGASIAQVAAIIRRLHRKHGIKAVAVDYLQLIKGDKKNGKEQEIAEISHTFQALAKELDLHVFLLSQQNKDGQTKYAVAAEEDADYVISIVQDRDGADATFEHKGLGIRKDRHNGKTGEMMRIVLQKQKLRFVEQVEDYQPIF